VNIALQFFDCIRRQWSGRNRGLEPGRSSCGSLDVQREFHRLFCARTRLGNRAPDHRSDGDRVRQGGNLRLSWVKESDVELPNGKPQVLIKGGELFIDILAEAHVSKLLRLGYRLCSKSKLPQALHRKLSKVIAV
jgi:hypothetical protein